MEVYFSVCIPVFNGELYLKECLDSVFSQTFTDYEVIVVDDGSTDGSLKLLKEYAQKYPQLKLYKNSSNLGLVGNWNECLSKAGGRWIKFLFQDDCWVPDCLEKVYTCTQISPAFVFHGRQFLIYTDVDPHIRAFYQSEEVCDFPPLSQMKHITPVQVADLVSRYPCFNFMGEPSNVTFKKELIDQFGFFDSDLIQLCDYEYWVRLTVHTGAYYLHDKLTTFRVHGKAATSGNSNKRYFRFAYLDPMLILRKWVKKKEYRVLKANQVHYDLIVLKYRSSQIGIIGYLNSLPSKERLICLKMIVQFVPFLLPIFLRELVIKIFKFGRK
jgi:glycosyltransferase involved in cell wall biosynthesis